MKYETSHCCEATITMDYCDECREECGTVVIHDDDPVNRLIANEYEYSESFAVALAGGVCMVLGFVAFAGLLMLIGGLDE